jgi:MFS family permease
MGRFYYGWVVLGVAALAMVGTLPGRTQGLGLVAEPLLRDLDLDRVRFAEMNVVATLIGSIFSFGVGGLVDRYGARLVLVSVAGLLGVVVVAMAGVATATALLILMTLTRGFGQSALSVVSLAMPGKWFRKRLTWAMGIYALAMSIGFMLAFPAVGALVLARGWRFAWTTIGVLLIAGLAPIAWVFVRSKPDESEMEIDSGDSGRSAAGDLPLGVALRSPAFWVFGVASSMYGLIASGIGLFNESILAERGFAPTVYHQALAVTAITGLAGNVAAGAWADRGSLRHVLLAALLILTAALVALPHVSALWHVMMQAIAMGVAGGFVMVVFFSFWGRAYGATHLGKIQGAAQAMTVVASAMGPLFFAWCARATGSYAMAFYVLAAILAALAAATARVAVPVGAEPARVRRATLT